jgi:DoxX-like family
MPLENQGRPTSKKMIWAGCIVSALPVLVLVASAIAKFVKPTGFDKGMAGLGWPLDLANPLGVVELISTILYLIPQTAVLGAILITGYLGGAIATHLRIGEYGNMILPFALGVLAWLGIALRDGRLWSLIPWRT